MAPEKARGIIDGLGGPGNIVKVDAVAETRLRSRSGTPAWSTRPS
jgi:phosphotransferase system IIB component